MKTKALLSVLFVFAFIATNYAQKIKQDGDLKFLKNVKSIDIDYSYENMGVGKYDNEEEYLSERVAKRNEKEAGTGDQWKQNWFDDREERFAPKFEELLNKYIADKGITASQNEDDAPARMVVKTTFTEPGFNVGVVRRSALINATILFVDTKTGKTMGTITVSKSPGNSAMGYDFDTGLRLQEAYAKMGKEVGKYLVKKVLK